MMTGKKTLAAIVLAAMLLSLVPALPAEPSAAQTPVVEIRYPGWQTRYNATSENPLMAQGYYHEVLVPHTGTEVWVNITHSQMGATANETNTYSFLKNSTGFYDVLYGKYLDESRCSADANGTLFFVALEVVDKREVPSGAPLSMFPRTLWELEAAADGNIVYITDLEVEVTGLRFGRQTESILFRLEPYSFDQSGDLEIGRPTEGVVNTGNIPFHLEVDFGVYSPYFTATNTSRLVYPLEQVEVEITLNPTGWSPRSDSFWVRFVADYPGNMVLATAPAMIVFNNSYEIPANVRIEVRFAGYGLYQLGNQEVVMQY
ncbi:MAG: hypothetical protein QCI38_04740, partial [Candidatus Thermoplasmatota archaeon]|nr:hypothetical protein [Candidatus Thermoplasmatota archaeon]